MAGSHTVTGTDSGKTGSATLTVTPGPLDHLVLTPSSSTTSPQTYTAEGFDQYNNSRGDVTLDTHFTISPDGLCTDASALPPLPASCTATTPGAHTVTGDDGGKTGTATLTI
jgi:hypothetical protein